MSENREIDAADQREAGNTVDKGRLFHFDGYLGYSGDVEGHGPAGPLEYIDCNKGKSYRSGIAQKVQRLLKPEDFPEKIINQSVIGGIQVRPDNGDNHHRGYNGNKENRSEESFAVEYLLFDYVGQAESNGRLHKYCNKEPQESIFDGYPEDRIIEYIDVIPKEREAHFGQCGPVEQTAEDYKTYGVYDKT